MQKKVERMHRRIYMLVFVLDSNRFINIVHLTSFIIFFIFFFILDLISLNYLALKILHNDGVLIRQWSLRFNDT